MGVIRLPGSEMEKIDRQAVDGLAGTPDSVAYILAEIESHMHGREYVFGADGDGFMLENEPVKWTVVGGDDAWGTELMISTGTEVESGSSTKKYDMNVLNVVSVSAANKISAVQFLTSAIGSAVACTFDESGGAAEDIVEAVAHGLSNGDNVVLEAGGGALPAALSANTVYYVVNKSDDYFQLSLTSGGAVVTFADDGGACFFYDVTAQTVATTNWVSMAATNSDSIPFDMRMGRVTCNQRLFIRAKSETGSTISIGFLVGLHTYEA
jgi:hypothetical protein